MSSFTFLLHTFFNRGVSRAAFKYEPQEGNVSPSFVMGERDAAFMTALESRMEVRHVLAGYWQNIDALVNGKSGVRRIVSCSG